MAINYRTHKPQTAKNWAGELKTVVYIGKCAACDRTVYGYTDEQAPDPRGLISPDHCNFPLEPLDYGKQGKPVPMCFTCMNTERTYTKGLQIALAQWHD